MAQENGEDEAYADQIQAVDAFFMERNPFMECFAEKNDSSATYHNHALLMGYGRCIVNLRM